MRLLDGNPDRLGVTGIGFVTQYECFDVFGWQQLGLMALAAVVKLVVA